MKVLKQWQLTTVLVGVLAFNGGCPGPDKAMELPTTPPQQVGQGAQSLQEQAGQLAEQGGDMAKKLSEQAMSLFEPLKEKLAGWESLKDKPAELKTSVNEMLESLENNISNVQLPESIKPMVESLKEQLTALSQYLEGAVESDKVQEYIDSLKKLVESPLGS